MTDETQQYVECVPNFSEGKERRIIEQICAAIEAVPRAYVLHVDMGRDANRTVVTFTASHDSVVDAGFAAIEQAAALIDMKTQRGAHRRIGATDVFPLVPLLNSDFDSCISLANRLASRVSQALDIPVYLYGKAAKSVSRSSIPAIRKGGYEALKHKIKTPEYKPDFGNAALPERSGATIIGVRDFLLAYNVNLSTTDVALAKRIARVLRTSGHFMRDDANRIVLDKTGKRQRVRGRLAKCQADGWLMPSYGLAQVTMNLLDYRQSGLHTAYEAVKTEARRLGIDVAGSELIGMAPKESLVQAGKYYQKKNELEPLDEDKLIDLAIESLGLSSVTPFEPATRILENTFTFNRLLKGEPTSPSHRA